MAYWGSGGAQGGFSVGTPGSAIRNMNRPSSAQIQSQQNAAFRQNLPLGTAFTPNYPSGGGGGAARPQRPAYSSILPTAPKVNKPNVQGSIDAAGLRQNYLPQNVVEQGMNQARDRYMRAASVQPLVENMAATQGNLASAASGQNLQMLPGLLHDAYQQAAATGMALPEADLQRYDFRTQALGAHQKELSDLARVALQRERDRQNVYSGFLGNAAQRAELARQAFLNR